MFCKIASYSNFSACLSLVVTASKLKVSDGGLLGLVKDMQDLLTQATFSAQASHFSAWVQTRHLLTQKGQLLTYLPKIGPN